MKNFYVIVCSFGAAGVLLSHVLSYAKGVSELTALGSLAIGVILCAPLVHVFLKIAKRKELPEAAWSRFWHAAYCGAPKWMWSLGGTAVIYMIVVGVFSMIDPRIATQTYQTAVALPFYLVAFTHAVGLRIRPNKHRGQLRLRAPASGRSTFKLTLLAECLTVGVETVEKAPVLIFPARSPARK